MIKNRQRRLVHFFAISNALGGMGTHTLNLAKTLSDRGNTVKIVQLGHDLSDKVDLNLYKKIIFKKVQIPNNFSN